MGQKSANRIIKKLLFANQDKKQLFYAFFGVVIGFVFISVSLHYLFLINKKNKSTEILDSNTITIQKEVSSSSTLSIATNSFSDIEVAFYEKMPFIEKIIKVENNNFPVELRSNDPLVPYFRSDIFIQSIPSDFLDVKSVFWKWKKGDKKVPIILPRDFVYMMNNFLSSTGMPQLSDEILKDVSFQLQVSKGSQNMIVEAEIIGFTNEISSILVPESFMIFGKQNFGDKKSVNYTQLMLKSKKGQFGLVEELIRKNHLQVKKNQLLEGRLKSMLTYILSSISFISLVVVLISIIVLIQYLQLLITKNAYEIRTMLRIGYFTKDIVIHYVRYVFFRLFFVLAFIVLVDFYVFYLLNKGLKLAGFIIEETNYNNVIFVLLSLFSLIFISTIFSANKFVKKEF
jgi:hypothetical protein